MPPATQKRCHADEGPGTPHGLDGNRAALPEGLRGGARPCGVLHRQLGMRGREAPPIALHGAKTVCVRAHDH